MRAVKLIATYDEYDDRNLGLMLQGVAKSEGFMACRDGSVIAHDLLEHQNGVSNIGPVWDEMEALGGIWYCRGQWGDLMNGRSYHTPAYNIAHDVTRMFEQWRDQEHAYCGPGYGRIGIRAHDYDEDFREIVGQAKAMIFQEADENWNDADLEQYAQFAMHRLRSGFSKAKRRYEGHGKSRYYGHGMFRAIKEAVAPQIKHLDWEGQELVLRYGNGEATCAPAELEYD